MIIIIIILSSKLETKYDYAAWNASYNDLGRNNCVCWGGGCLLLMD